MIHSFRFRLLVAFILVILVTIGTISFFVGRSSGSEIQQYGQRSEEMRFRRMDFELIRYYRGNGSWEGIQPYIEQWGSLYGHRIIVTDAGGMVVADSEAKLLGKQYRSDIPGRRLSPPWEIDTPGILYISPESSAGFPSPLSLSQSINRFLLWGGLLAVAIALLITFLLSRHISAPIKALSFAARRLGQGDLSQRVQFEDGGEMGELAQTFNSMAGDLERTEKLRRNMVADAAHELRTPLSNIRGYLEAISDGVVAPDTATIHSLQEEAVLLSQLVDDLQELALADAGELKMILQYEDISELVSHAVAGVKAQTALKGVSLSVDITGKLPAVSVDSRRINQVMRNLLDNALTHTAQGGTITVTARQMANHQLEVAVVDTGQGIPAEDLPNIFERFYRVDKSRTRVTGGSGLGLTIVKRLVEAHGG
ncbi:MAG: HAMP domain-containing protein, partial [Chloroflexi bacterium]|nr:HAMP domain-containing protein [Chloroflexota bacterium]